MINDVGDEDAPVLGLADRERPIGRNKGEVVDEKAARHDDQACPPAAEDVAGDHGYDEHQRHRGEAQARTKWQHRRTEGERGQHADDGAGDFRSHLGILVPSLFSWRIRPRCLGSI